MFIFVFNHKLKPEYYSYSYLSKNLGPNIIRIHIWLFWLLGVLIGSLFHKKWVLIGSLSQSLGVLISFRDSGSASSEHCRAF